MQYMFLIYLDENSLSESQRAQCYSESAGYARELQAKGKRVSASPLQPTYMAKSVRHRNGGTSVTDGPFAETKEHLGGFFLAELDSMDEAVEIAGRIPAGKWGTVEVRPVLDIPPLLAG